MSRFYSGDQALPNIFCSDCSSQLDSQLVESLINGEDVYCAACGKHFDKMNKDLIQNYINRKKNMPTQKQQNFHQTMPKNISIQPPTPLLPPQPPTLKNSSVQFIKPNTSTLQPSNFIPTHEHPDSPYSPPKYPTLNNSSVQFQKFNSSKYDQIPVNKQYADPRAYKQNMKSNRKELRKILRSNEKTYFKPYAQDKKKFELIKKNNKKIYKNTVKENERIFKITLLQNHNADPITLKHITQEYHQIVKANKKKYHVSEKKIIQQYEKTAKVNRNDYRKIQKANKRNLRRLKKSNTRAFKLVIKTGNGNVSYLDKLQPISYESQTFLPYHPGETAIPPELTQITAQKSNYDPISGNPIQKVKRFDPITGKPLLDNFETKIFHESEISQPEKETVVAFQNELFSILDPNIHKILMNINLSEQDRQLIAKSFIYLTIEQQSKYLEELQQINSMDSEERKSVIQSIKKLRIPEEQQKILIDQLDYIPEENHGEYVATLEIAENEDFINKSAKKEEKKPEVVVEQIKINNSDLHEKIQDPLTEIKNTESLNSYEDHEVKETQEKDEKIKLQTVLEQERMEKERLESERLKKERDEVENLKQEKEELERIKRVRELKEKVKKKESKELEEN